MSKIPLHNIFEKVLGVGKINNKKDFDKLIKELEKQATEEELTVSASDF